MTLQDGPRYGGRGGTGRRLTELDESTAVAKRRWTDDSEGKRKGRRAAAGAAIGAGVAHAPAALYGAGLATAMQEKGPARMVGNTLRAYKPTTIARVTAHNPKYAALLGGGALAGAGIGAATGGKKKVSKSGRSYDPEHRRQRRIGMGEAALLIGGGALGLRGGKGVVGTSRAARAVGWAAKGKPSEAELRAALSSGITARRSDLAQLGGGAAAVTGAGALRQHAESRRGRAYN